MFEIRNKFEFSDVGMIRNEFSLFGMKTRIQNGMIEKKKARRFDLEERTFQFAKRCRAFVKNLKQTIANVEDGRQLIRASGSVGANYIEANEALSRKDFMLHIKICRKESKESRYWLRLMDAGTGDIAHERDSLAQEAEELMNIFGAILRNSER